MLQAIIFYIPILVLSAVLQNLIGVAHNYGIPQANLHARLNCNMQRIEAIILLIFKTLLITVVQKELSLLEQLFLKLKGLPVCFY